MAQNHILLIDDDAEFCAHLTQLLQPFDYIVEAKLTSLDAAEALKNEAYDLILLDWNLPGCTGIELCRDYRDNGGETPIIFLTARSEVTDKEGAFEAGGDDYLCKPFDVRELLLRIRGLSMRSRKVVSKVLRIQHLELFVLHNLAKAGKKQVCLTPTESSILAHLMSNPNRLSTTKQILQAVFPNSDDRSTAGLRQRMAGLRRKLKSIDADALIETVGRGGYVIRTSPEDICGNTI